jgi:Trk K+ transport system NAD-binding subunit
MNTLQRRTLYYVSLIAAVMFGYTLVYHYGMAAFEGEQITFLHALQVVVETFTTTGFGSDAPWQSPQMNVLIILMDLTGVALIFLALPVLVFPLFEEMLSTTVPTTLEEGVSDHVIICTYTPRAETLISELESWNVEYVIVEPDREHATDLYENGYRVIHEDPDSVSGLESAQLSTARALVADVSDQVDASIVLTAQEVAEDVRIVSVVEEPDRATYHRLAGADTVLSPRPLLGQSLANKVTTAVTTKLGDAIEIGEEFDIVEFPIHRGSDLVGKTLAQSGLRERAGVNVIGAWFQGEFESPPSPDSTLESGTVLLVTGRESQLGQLKGMTLGPTRPFARGETIVVGYGEVGQTIVSALEDVDLPYTVIDHEDKDGVDVVGDATEPDVLKAAGIDSSRSVILAIPDDTAAEFATLVVRDLSEDIEIIARAEESETVQKMYRAGADYVLSLAVVSGRMIASAVLDEEVIAMDTQVEVLRTQAPGLVGKTLGGARVRSKTGCTVVAVERDGTVVTDLGPDFRIQHDDELVIAGTDEGTNRFTEMLG